jgi:hypothetical protein
MNKSARPAGEPFASAVLSLFELFYQKLLHSRHQKVAQSVPGADNLLPRFQA